MVNATVDSGFLGGEDLVQFSMGLLNIAIAIVILVFLTTIISYVVINLVVRKLVNERIYRDWLSSACNVIREESQYSRFANSYPILDELRSRAHGDLDPIKLPDAAFALHPQRLSAQISNRLQSTAELDEVLSTAFLLAARDRTLQSLTTTRVVDAVPENPDGVEDTAPWQDEPSPAIGKKTYIQIDRIVDDVQVRLLRADVTARYATTFVVSAALCALVLLGLKVGLNWSYIAYAASVGMISAAIAAMIEGWLDRPSIM